ncbi:hypothetical protein [Corynebacterium halotolerans]|uniref:hypothetical protein n=1 Tax=Corynebacterium halotolerans TaxID=225326 RepID=UPI003CF9272F
METIAFVLAGVAAVGAAALWFVDASRRRGTDETTEPATPGSPTAPETAPGASGTAGPPAGPDVTEPTPEAPDHAGEEPLDVEIEEEAEPAPDAAPPTPEPTPETGPVTGTAEEPVEAAEAGESDDDEPGEDPAEPGEAAAERKPRHRPGLSLPGAQRRERRTWAEDNGWEFKRTDEYLDDEWERGAAASGAVVRDVVSGAVYGKEMHLVDLGGVTVMALRRGAASDVVVDLRRIADIPADRGGESPDLVPVGDVHGFRLFATEAGPAERFIDERVKAALDALPELVTAVWVEGDWVLAQTGKGSRLDTWDEMCAPLASLADAARTLPPPLNAPQALNLDDLDPTRLMPPRQKPVVEPHPPVAEAPAPPLVIRPEEPLELPTRQRAESRGVVEPRAVGADEVEPIAEGTPDLDPEDYNGLRVLRDLSDGPSIFDDLAQELGTDPLRDDKN